MTIKAKIKSVNEDNSGNVSVVLKPTAPELSGALLSISGVPAQAIRGQGILTEAELDVTITVSSQ